MPDIVVVGDINVDVNISIPAYPIPGNEAIANSVQMHTGGSAVNTAIALSKMDMDVGFVGRPCSRWGNTPTVSASASRKA